MSQKKTNGEVIFVGAGPGDPELITVKGVRALERADRVIYAGSLVNPELLGLCRQGTPVHDSAHLTLEEVISLMYEGTSHGETIVRLHTGDPSMYGAIKEQFDHLDQQAIRYSVIPGVSSVFAAAAAIKREFTLPDISQTLILTRLAGRTPVPEREALAKLAKHQASMAIFLSVQDMQSVVDALVEGGYPASTPIAVIAKASWPDEEILQGTLETIVEKVKLAGIRKQAQILVGDFLDPANGYARSKLYDPTFTHEYRQGSKP
ncbi:precorrin-4 C(11)-methyltransferase [Desulfosporosinus fructosivorans]|uniref:Precorrin-4 C(11)-methyltransferase n=1 Tax=Desulfosporosinus fructosivorans TaxID=2018669 RepID=A0A4Z0R1N7_9FIRM|nr:precorrin-4 C(11)-methyltransferase [Desulfosporosinus fructosivorans]TGE36093.1 precorrin-4 C(11)-methyltransferase [Desulfosporosinus fructosivorans]